MVDRIQADSALISCSGETSSVEEKAKDGLLVSSSDLDADKSEKKKKVSVAPFRISFYCHLVIFKDNTAKLDVNCS